MTAQEFNKKLDTAKALDCGGYSYSCAEYFKRDLEVYCKIIMPENYPLSKTNPTLVFNLKKIKKDNIFKIPKKINSLKLDCGVGGRILIDLMHEVGENGINGLQCLIKKIINA